MSHVTSAAIAATLVGGVGTGAHGSSAASSSLSSDESTDSEARFGGMPNGGGRGAAARHDAGASADSLSHRTATAAARLALGSRSILVVAEEAALAEAFFTVHRHKLPIVDEGAFRAAAGLPGPTRTRGRSVHSGGASAVEGPRKVAAAPGYASLLEHSSVAAGHCLLVSSLLAVGAAMVGQAAAARAHFAAAMSDVQERFSDWLAAGEAAASSASASASAAAALKDGGISAKVASSTSASSGRTAAGAHSLQSTSPLVSALLLLSFTAHGLAGDLPLARALFAAADVAARRVTVGKAFAGTLLAIMLLGDQLQAPQTSNGAVASNAGAGTAPAAHRTDPSRDGNQSSGSSSSIGAPAIGSAPGPSQLGGSAASAEAVPIEPDSDGDSLSTADSESDAESESDFRAVAEAYALFNAAVYAGDPSPFATPEARAATHAAIQRARVAGVRLRLSLHISMPLLLALVTHLQQVRDGTATAADVAAAIALLRQPAEAAALLDSAMLHPHAAAQMLHPHAAAQMLPPASAGPAPAAVATEAHAGSIRHAEHGRLEDNAHLDDLDADGADAVATDAAAGRVAMNADAVPMLSMPESPLFDFCSISVLAQLVLVLHGPLQPKAIHLVASTTAAASSAAGASAAAASTAAPAAGSGGCDGASCDCATGRYQRHPSAALLVPAAQTLVRLLA